MKALLLFWALAATGETHEEAPAQPPAEGTAPAGSQGAAPPEDPANAPGVSNPPVRELTFEEAVDLGLAYNLGLKSKRFDALIARMDVEEQDAAWDTTLGANVEGGETRIPTRSQLEGAQTLETDTFAYGFGLTKPLRIGPTLGLDWRTDRLFTNSSFSTINPSYDTALELSLTVPLLRGRGRQAQESDLRASVAGAQGARYTLLSEAELLVESIAVAYWNLVYLEDRVRVLEKSLDEGIVSLREGVVAADASLKGERLRLARGSSAILDVAQLEESFTTAELRLLETRTKVEQARIRLQRATGGLLARYGVELSADDEVRKK